MAETIIRRCTFLMVIVLFVIMGIMLNTVYGQESRPSDRPEANEGLEYNYELTDIILNDLINDVLLGKDPQMNQLILFLSFLQEQTGAGIGDMGANVTTECCAELAGNTFRVMHSDGVGSSGTIEFSSIGALGGATGTYTPAGGGASSRITVSPPQGGPIVQHRFSGIGGQGGVLYCDPVGPPACSWKFIDTTGPEPHRRGTLLLTP